jgi:L-lactate dehydrogenase complex protein LldF
VCPVYERTGGHAYGSVYPGPIGAVLTPQLVGVEHAASLPFASTLCGACYDACPVKIDIPQVLAHLRAEVVEAKRADRVLPTVEGTAMKLATAVLAKPGRLGAVQRLAARGSRLLARDGRIGALPGPLGRWSETRDTPQLPAESFRAWWRRTRGEKHRDDRA